jgi:CRP-like cAMP-binding protein
MKHTAPPGSELRKLFSKGRKLSYKKGEIIQRANETPRGVYFLSEGFVKEYTLSSDGSEHLTIVYEPGDLFSVNWMFLNIMPNVYREAHTPVVVYRLFKDDFMPALDRSDKLQKEILSLMISQVHMLSSRVENLTFNNAYDKIAYHLIHLAGRFGTPHKDGWFITLPLRHQQIAESLSMSRETATRMLARIERQGLIIQDGKGHYILRDVSALASTIGVEEVLGMWPNLADTSGDNNHE